MMQHCARLDTVEKLQTFATPPRACSSTVQLAQVTRAFGSSMEVGRVKLQSGCNERTDM